MTAVSEEVTPNIDSNRNFVSIVTVTYGDRIHLVEQVVEACLSDPMVTDVHLVSNNSKSDLTSLEMRWGDRIKVVRLAQNAGSAAGFGKGIESALAGGCHYIMLLDDDNMPEPDCISILLSKLRERSEQFGKDRTAVLALREFNYEPYLQGLKPEWHHPRPGSFLGFSIIQTIERKIGMRQHRRPSKLPEAASLPHGIYGGLMARRELFAKVGLPDPDLVLYADDIEYTQRILADAGTLDLVFGARILDLDGRHTADVGERSIFRAKLKAASMFRLYYATRNSVWLSKRRSKGRWLTYWFNRAVYLYMIRHHAHRLGMPPSYDIFMTAVRDGEAGRLGINDNHPLPQ